MITSVASTSSRGHVKAEGLKKSFGSVVALDGVDLAVKAGTVLALLGPNGAGKTTLVRILTTLSKPDSGYAQVAGYDVVRQAAQLRAAIGLAGQQVALDDYLTGRENLQMVANLYHLGMKKARRRAAELLSLFDLNWAGARTAKAYSGGMRRRLYLAASLVGQ
ncbi:MAG: ATP-binding cassette domain-containing protein, partial [Actinobacteria bacterium]|nr:ATP-binding cassette domain-containing protein [Actinomycetota bacterium]